MKLLRFKKLNEAGFGLHFILPVLAILAVAGMGSYLLAGSHAATPTCRNFTFYSGGNNVASGYDINTKNCVTYIQDIVNGVDEQNTGAYQTMEQAYDKYYGQKDGEMGGVGSGSYNLLTKTHVEALQATFDYSDNTTNGAYKQLGISGQVNASTWSALCGVAAGYKGKTTTWAKAAYAAYTAPASGCDNGWGGTVKEDHHGSIGMPAAVVKPVAVAKPATTTGAGNGSAPQSSTGNAAAKAETAYTSSTQYSATTCSTLRAYNGVTAAMKSAYPNCWNTNAQSSSSYCKNQVIRPYDIDIDNPKTVASATNLKNANAYCF